MIFEIDDVYKRQFCNVCPDRLFALYDTDGIVIGMTCNGNRSCSDRLMKRLHDRVMMKIKSIHCMV